jgi:hypothetical protein
VGRLIRLLRQEGWEGNRIENQLLFEYERKKLYQNSEEFKKKKLTLDA